MDYTIINWSMLLISTIITIVVVLTRQHMSLKGKAIFFALWIVASIVFVPIVAVVSFLEAYRAGDDHINWFGPSILITIVLNVIPSSFLLLRDFAINKGY